MQHAGSSYVARWYDSSGDVPSSCCSCLVPPTSLSAYHLFGRFLVGLVWMGSEELSSFFFRFCFPFFLVFSSFFFAFLCFSLILSEDKGKRLQSTAKWGSSLRSRLHRPHAKRPDLSSDPQTGLRYLSLALSGGPKATVLSRCKLPCPGLEVLAR